MSDYYRASETADEKLAAARAGLAAAQEANQLLQQKLQLSEAEVSRLNGVIREYIDWLNTARAELAELGARLTRLEAILQPTE